jgi:lipid-binding SYLF domain-containing protein
LPPNFPGSSETHPLDPPSAILLFFNPPQAVTQYPPVSAGETIQPKGEDCENPNPETTPQRKLLFLALARTVARLANASTDVEKQQKQIRSMTQDTLQRLYKADPRTKAAVKNASGYAVVKIFFAGSGNGKGLAVNNKTEHETFMKMIELQAGLGMGVDKFRVIFLFDDKQAFDGSVNSGWEFGGQSTAAAKYGDKGAAMGGAVSVADGVWMYQLTEKGLAADISATGTKYYKDDQR